MFRAGFSFCAAVAAFAFVSTGSATNEHSRLAVFFVRGEQLAGVERAGRTPEDAIRQLLLGPSTSELRLGYRTYVPAGTHVKAVTVANHVATIDLDARFASGTDANSLLARLAQVVRTLTGLEGTTRVQLLVNGTVTAAQFPGVSLSRPITFKSLQTPNVEVPSPPNLKLPAPDPAVKTVQQRLIELGYLVPGEADGRSGPATQNAILAFQKWEHLTRSGLLDQHTQARLDVATHPQAVTRGPRGKRAEVLLDRQVALLIRDNQVIRTIAVSTGKPSTPTPPGNYHVYAKIPRWWSTPFREWLPWAVPFVGGIAFHELGDVPAYPASHGCVRQLYTVARWTYNFATVGMPVTVIARS